MDNDNRNHIEQQRTLTRSLHIVLVLTFIGSGFMCLSRLVSGLSLPVMRQLFDSEAISLPEEMTVAMDTFLNLPQTYFLLCAILYGLSLTGAIMMWNLRKNGFHFYAVAQLLLIAVSIMFLGRNGVKIGDIMLTVLFIAYYYMILRTLGLFNKNKNNNDCDSYDAVQDYPADDNDPTDENSAP